MSTKKQASHKPRYGEREIRRMVDEGERALERGEMFEDPWLTTAAAYALDLFDMQEAAKVRLDFTARTQGGVDGAFMFFAAALQHEGYTEPEVRQTLAKRLAAYMMFQAYNDLCEMGVDARADCSPFSYSVVATLPGGETISYDFLGRAMFTLGRFAFGGPGNLDVLGTLQPFYEGLYKGLMRPAFLALGVDVEGLERARG